MNECHRRTLWASEVVVSPLPEHRDDRAKALAELGQVVFKPFRPCTVLASLEEAFLLELAQPGGEDIAWRPGMLDHLSDGSHPWLLSATTSTVNAYSCSTLDGLGPAAAVIERDQNNAKVRIASASPLSPRPG